MFFNEFSANSGVVGCLNTYSCEFLEGKCNRGILYIENASTPNPGRVSKAMTLLSALFPLSG